MADEDAERRDRHGALPHVARRLGIGSEWVRQLGPARRRSTLAIGRVSGARSKPGRRSSSGTNRWLRRANEILKSVSVFFGLEVDRRPPR